MPSLYHVVIQIINNLNLRDSATLKDFHRRSVFDLLPSHSPAPISKRRNTLHIGNRKDYRYGPIRIDWIEFEVMNKDLARIKNGSDESEWNTPMATFIPGSVAISGTSNLPDGVVHIFRERMSATAPDSSSASSSKATGLAESLVPDEKVTADAGEELTIVAVLAVPPWMTPSDFLAFVAPASDGMKHLRLIRDVSPNHTMVVIQFRDHSNTEEFIEEFNGRQYNSVEPETCNIVRVKSVMFDMDDPVSLTINRSSAKNSMLYELPTCPVCLDRMDASATGLVTVPCSHTFHCMCLSKWGDSRCPVCRYSQFALSSTATSSSSGLSHIHPPSSAGMASCSECDSRINLWICLICGNIGCGRQGRAHAKSHYELTTHLYAMDLETQRVWDYAGDNYVHRLIQNKADGKLVELPSASNMEVMENRNRNGQGPQEDDNLKAEKMEIMAMQYSQILQRAMDDQRETYEEQFGELRRKLDDAQRKLEVLNADISGQMHAFHNEQERQRKEYEEQRMQLEKEKQKAEKKADKFSDLARKLEREVKEERAVSEGLMKNLTSAKEKLNTAEKEKVEFTTKVKDLEDQMRDVMFFLEARDKIETSQGVEAEAAGGSIELPPQPPTKGNGNKKKKKK